MYGVRPRARAEMRRRAWEEYARDVAGGGADHRPRKKVRLGRAGVRAWVELTLVLGLMIGLNAGFFPNDPGFRRLEFNPFLVPVVLLALRFGTLIGGAAGLASALWMIVASRHASLEDGSAVLLGLLVIAGALTGSSRSIRGNGWSTSAGMPAAWSPAWAAPGACWASGSP